MPIRFKYPELLRELRDLERVASSDFLTNSHVLQQYTLDLERAQYRDQTVRWEIPALAPLMTRPSRSYESDHQGSLVYGSVSGVWDIRQVHDRVFQIVDQASFVAKIHDATSHVPIAEWHFDIAQNHAPGAWLHSQVQWHQHSLPVPRFPAFVVTLVDVIDFLLGELHQVDWPKVIQRRQSAAQNERLTLLLEAMLQSVRGKGAAHGLMTLKSLRPSAGMFAR